MALSNSQDFSLDAQTLIKMAMQQVGAIGEGETPTLTQLTEANLLLNVLIKHLQNDDIQLWIRKRGYVLPITTTGKNLLGAEGDQATNVYNYTTTTAASLISTSSITIALTTGFVIGYFIGVEQSGGAMQWTTISNVVGNVVTLATPLTGAVSIGANIYAYQTKIYRPMRVLESVRRLSLDNTDTMMTRWSQSEYDNHTNKFVQGTPVNWFYDETLGYGASGYPGNGEFHLWPVPLNGQYVIPIRYTKVFDDMDTVVQNFEFPQSWFMTLFTGMVWLLSGRNGNQLSERKLAMQEFMVFHAEAKATDQELGSFYITPKYMGRR